MYLLKSEVLSSFTLTLMGTIDCLTTVIGVLYFGATEINPLLSGLVSTSILAFIIVKVTASFCIAATYALARKILNNAEDKTSRSFKFGNIFIKLAFVGLITFLFTIVTNNIIVLIT